MLTSEHRKRVKLFGVQADLFRSGCVSQSGQVSFDKYNVYCELGGLDESRGVSDGMQSHAMS